MKAINTIFLFSACLTVYSQTIQLEIDEQIWVPFTQAWEANDGESFNAIHSDDVWRINPGRLLVGSEYKSRNAENMQGQSTERIIEFTFESRTSNGDNAYEVGYYRIKDTSGGEPKFYVGRFHVAFKKFDGVWKIIQDWDTGEINGVEITPKSLENRDFTHFE